MHPNHLEFPGDIRVHLLATENADLIGLIHCEWELRLGLEVLTRDVAGFYGVVATP